ncbi:MAG: type III pantothenate kinase [Flavobacteriales bacterium]|nr:type III pantothenate kinase [Flavobacteriales bacterium]
MSEIVLDIGNSRAKGAFFSQGDLIENIVLPQDLMAAIGPWIDRHHPERMLVSSTADEHLDLQQWLPEYAEVQYLTIDTPLPIQNSYESDTLGQDRIANAVAGHLKNSAASLVIDAGSCVTYDWTVDGTYLGGSISPGLRMRTQAMHHFTGRLPQVEGPFPDEVLASTTTDALRSGAFHGLRLEIDGIIRLFRSRFPEGTVLITGGDALLLADRLENDIFADPLLTLRGLHAILTYHST